MVGKCNAHRFAPEILSKITEVVALHERDSIIILPTRPNSEPEDNEVATRPLLTLSHCTGVPLRMPPPMESVIKTHAPRLHRLDLLMVPARQNITLLLESLQATHLEVLTITSSCMYHTSIAGPVMTPDLLLNGETSSLKALAIMLIVNWIPSDTPFPHLTHLFISFDAAPGLGHPFDVLKLLSNTPMLSFLHVNLLVYDGPHSADTGILLQVVFRSTSSSMIHEFDSEGYPAPLPPLALRPVTFLDISTDQEQIRMVADGPTSGHGVWLDGLYEASDVPDPAGWETWLVRLPESIVLSHITHLHIHLAPLSVFLPGLLRHLPQVSHLAVLFGEPTASNATNTGLPPVQLQNVSFPMSVLSLALSPSPAPRPATNNSTATTPSVRCPVLQTLLIEWQETVTLESATAFPGIAAMLVESARALDFPSATSSCRLRGASY
ncbi:hypothetical protein GSI_03118 [Ganoderma sinense ZZ0214-1]|uniref:F-box domain-containing protein n=1 Tax=Ganoderma sinense ZZ0214-1 TaxID=1077348 RepID=A0A2G8SKS4_9APHY|nr:hypothetical protein GSI_03118 [Ganoderma sinense ZZ0214-1]